MKVKMSILRSNERKDDSNKLKKHNVIPYVNLILSRKSFYGSSFIQSLIPKIFEGGLTAFLVVQF